MSYGSILQQAAAAARPPIGPPPPMQQPGPTPLASAGAPPAMPVLPNAAPPPTNVGKLDTGAKTPKDAASDAINSLRELKSHFPGMAAQLDPVIESIKAAATPGGAAQAKSANDGVDSKLGDAVKSAIGAPPEPDETETVED